MNVELSPSTQQHLRQELTSRWLAGERDALRLILNRLPVGQRLPTLRLLLPEELRLRQAAGEKIDSGHLRELYPEARDIIPEYTEDVLYMRTVSNTAKKDPPTPLQSIELRLGTEIQSADSHEHIFHGRTQTPPKQIDHYEILEEVGRGGMGVVYKARDGKLKRIVALKMLLSGAFADSSARKRFRREAEVLAQVKHPHLVQIYDVGEADGKPYLVLEYIDGINLAVYVKRRPINPRLAATLVEQVARAVQAAHDHGIIHRDLKPGNILLVATSESGVQQKSVDSWWSLKPFSLAPKLTDFGLAKRLDPHTAATTAGQVLGTAQYMAPEQAAGDSSRVGPAADVYGLGAILYELLTGVPPISGENLFEILMHVKHQEPTTPSQITPSVPRDLGTICMKCLEKEQSRRYPSATALADDLARFLRGEPIAARPVGELEKAWRWGRRNPIVTSLAAALVFSLALLALVFAWQWLQTQSANRALAERNQLLALARDAAQRARQAAVVQRDELRRQRATETFLRGVEAAESGDATLGLFLMERSLELATPDMTDFRRVVGVNLVEWARSVPEVLGPIPGRSLELYSMTPDRAQAWIWPAKRDELLLMRLDNGQAVGPALAIPPGSQQRGRSMNAKWLALPLLSPARVEIWDAERRCRHAVIPHPVPLWSTVVRADGAQLATLDEEGRLRVWELPTGRLLVGPTTVVARMNREYRLEFSSWEDLLIKGEGFGQLVSGTTGQPLKLAEGGQVLALQLQGRRLLVERRGTEVDTAGRPVLVDSRTGQLGKEYKFPLGLLPHTASFAGAGDVVAVAVHDHQVNFWSLDRGLPTWTPLRGPDVAGVILDPAFEYGLSRYQRFRMPRPVSSMNAQARLAAVPSRSRHMKQGHVFHIGAGARWAAALRLLAASQPLAVRFSHLNPVMPFGQPILVTGDVLHAVASTEDGQRLAVGSYQYGVYAGWISVMDARTGAPLLPPLEHTNYVAALAFSPDGQRLAVGDFNLQVLVWNLANGRLVRAPLKESEIITALAWSPDGRTLAVGTASDFSGRPHVRLWDLDRGQPSFPPCFLSSEITALKFSADGRTLLAVGKDNVLAIDVATGRGRHQEILAPMLNAAELSSTSDCFALGNGDGSVALHRLSTGELIGQIAGRQAVFSLAFAPDGATLAVGYQNGSVRIWDLATRLPMGAPRVQGAAVVGLAFRPQSGTFVAASADGRIREWPLPPPPLASTGYLRQRLEVLTGVTYDGAELLVLSPEDWNQRHQELSKRQALAPLTTRLDDATWHDLRARDAEENGDAGAALWHLDRLLALRPSDPLLLLRQAQAYLSQGEVGLAEASCRRAAKLLSGQGPQSTDSIQAWHFDQLLVTWAADDTSLALWHADQLITHWPTAQAHWFRAELHRAIGQAVAAANDEQQALNLGLPKHDVYTLIFRRAEAGDWTGANQLLSAALVAGNPPLSVRSKLALVLAKAGRHQEAISQLEELVEVSETRATGAWIRQQMCTILALESPRPLLERMLARIESIKPAATHPLHATYAAMAGALQIRLGQHREGAARLVAALPEAEEQVRPVLLAVLALADLEAGHAGAARQSLDQARMQLKQQSSVWYQTCASLLIDEVTRRLPKD